MVVVMIDYKPVVCEIFWHDNQVAMCTLFLHQILHLFWVFVWQELSLLDDTVLEEHNESAELIQIIPLDGGKSY